MQSPSRTGHESHLGFDAENRAAGTPAALALAIGFDLKDDQGNINRAQPYEAGVDLGFRLWNAELRRRQPLPPVGLTVGN